MMFKYSLCPIRASKTIYFHTSCSLHIKDYYQILSVPRNASQKQIKEAYYEKARLCHPDTNKGSSASGFQEILEAYEVLTDEAKRRTYDSTTVTKRPHPRVHINRDNRENREPISMSHIHQVYKTLNSEENEQPRFRPFEDHTYPGTDFNRFEYSRRWDPQQRAWIYMKRQTANEYQKRMQDNQKKLRICISIVSFGSLIYLLNYKFFLRKM